MTFPHTLSAPATALLACFFALGCDSSSASNDGADSGRADASTGTDPNITVIDSTTGPCKAAPCAHGSCSVEGDSYACTCDDGFTGDDCDVEVDVSQADDCDPNPCQHGTCSSDTGDAVCTCDAGWEGDRCDVDTDDCDPNPCANGLCSDGLNQYTCACGVGFEGSDCDVDSDDCDPDPCVNGTCIDDVAGFDCKCDDGFFGGLCDIACDDGDVATLDWHDDAYGCGHRIADWTVFDSGLQADHSADLLWWLVPTSITYENFKTECAGLDMAGQSDFRLPTIDETRTWGAGCADTITGGTCLISDPGCLAESCGFGVSNECQSCQGGQGPHAAAGYCRPEIPVCPVLWTSSACGTGCDAGEVWFFGITNGNFSHSQPTGGRRGACVAAVNLP